jgi:hypothetical protein
MGIESSIDTILDAGTLCVAQAQQFYVFKYMSLFDAVEIRFFSFHRYRFITDTSLLAL